MRYTLSTDLLLKAYRQGIFPMDEEGVVYWYDPNPRTILPLDETFHISRTLARTVRQGVFELRVDTMFRTVMQHCAERRQTWISPEFVEAYGRLHDAGYAHSVEAWQNGALVGGLYGVAVGGLFAGESMFSRATDSSKVALVHLYERLRAGGFVLWDTQFMTAHLAKFGAHEIPRGEYKRRLQKALEVKAKF